jgi:thiol-disulfide isomerase/thioredoxin
MRIRQWIEKAEFENRILKSSAPRIVLFAADWCGYCRRFLSLVDEYQTEPKGLSPPSDEVVVVDVDSGNGSLWDDFNIDLVPTIAVFLKGREIFRRDGKASIGLEREDLEDAIRAIISKNT